MPRALRSSEITEADWQRQVLELADLLGWIAYHTHDSRRSEPGFPDLVLCRDRVIYAELKSMRGRVRPEQGRWLDALRAAGGEAYVWRPADIDHVAAVLRTRKVHLP